jgi:hypothetical protein
MWKSAEIKRIIIDRKKGEHFAELQLDVRAGQ